MLPPSLEEELGQAPGDRRSVDLLKAVHQSESFLGTAP